MTLWILILVYHGSTFRGVSGVATTSVQFHSEAACVDAAHVATQKGFDEAFCVEDATKEKATMGVILPYKR